MGLVQLASAPVCQEVHKWCEAKLKRMTEGWTTTTYRILSINMDVAEMYDLERRLSS